MRGAYFFKKLFPNSYPKSNSLHFKTACNIVGEELNIERARVEVVCKDIRKTFQAREHLMSATPDPPHPRLVELVSRYGSSSGPLVLDVADVPVIQDTVEEVDAFVMEPVNEALPRESVQNPIAYSHARNQAAKYILVYGMDRYPELLTYVASGALMYWSLHKHGNTVGGSLGI